MFGRKKKYPHSCDMCNNIIDGYTAYYKIKKRYLIHDKDGVWFWDGDVYICHRCLDKIRTHLK